MKPNLVTLFILGIFFSFMSYLATTLEKDELKSGNAKRILAIIIIKALLGGAIAIVIFYGLEYLYPKMGEFLRVGLACTGAFLIEHIRNIGLSLLRIRLGVKDDNIQ